MPTSNSHRALTQFAIAGSGGTTMPRRTSCKRAATFPAEAASAVVRPTLACPESTWRVTVGTREEIAESPRIRREPLPLLMSGRVRVRGTVEVGA